MLRVAIVDDDEWVRIGRSVALAESGEVTVGFVGPHSEALSAGPSIWADIDVALIDAYDTDADFDHFAGVGVVEQIKALDADRRPVLIVITGHLLDDVLRLRMAEAGADYLFGHGEVRTVEQLLLAIRDPASVRSPGPPNPEALDKLGLTLDSRPNQAMHWVDESGLAEVFVEAAEGESQKTFEVGRRRIRAARQQLAARGGFRRTADGQRTSVPEWQQIVSIVSAARGKRRNEPPR
jgi:CheY-like chemotaxis protein